MIGFNLPQNSGIKIYNEAIKYISEDQMKNIHEL